MSVPQKGHFWLSALSHLTVSLICLPHLKHVISSGKLSKNIVLFYNPPASGKRRNSKFLKNYMSYGNSPRRRTRAWCRAFARPREWVRALSDSNIIYAPAFTGDAAVTSHPPGQYNLVDASLRETHHAVDKSARVAVHACRPASGLPQQLLIMPL
jgi:hypothetical protein